MPHTSDVQSNSSLCSIDKTTPPIASSEPASINDNSKISESASMAIKLALQDAKALPVIWVTDYDALEKCLDDLETCERAAFDTEFIKRDTYYPKLALIQINTGKRIYLVDAPKLDLSEFWVVLEEMPLMIWHACGEDLGIFYLLSNSPALENIFDTQIGLSYISDQQQMGYQQALSQELGIEVSKAESQSDWLARPLTQEQEHYAIDDVRYLLALYDVVTAQLIQKNLMEKAEQDSQLYAYELFEASNIEDDATYLAMADYRYTGEQLAVLQSVSSWREALARATNQPKTFILKKQAMREVVTEMPRSIKQLTQKTSMHRGMVRLYGDELIAVIKDARQLSEAEQPARLLTPYRSKDKTVIKAVQRTINEQAKRLGIPPNVFIRKKWLTKVFEVVAYELPYEQLPEALKGWRKEWVESTLLPVVESHKDALQAGMGITQQDVAKSSS